MPGTQAGQIITTHLPNILVLHPTNLLNIRRTLTDILKIIPRQLNLILLILTRLHLNPRMHLDPPHDLLPQEIPDLHLPQSVVGLVQVHVYGKVGVDVAELVLVAAGDAGDHVGDYRADCAEGGDGFAGAVVHFYGYEVGGGVAEGDGEVLEVFCEFACCGY